MLVLLDKVLFVSHALLVAFVLVGWAWRRARPLHLVATGLTAFSWFVLGAHRGVGYCLLTDWHVQVRRRMGREDAGLSYLQLVASEVFDVALSRAEADGLGGALFGLMLIAAAVAWGRQWWRWSGLGQRR
jgi:hypothetical protein